MLKTIGSWTHLMRNDAFPLESLDQFRDHTRVIQSIRSVSRDEDIDVPASLLASPVRAHDLDPDLGINCHSLSADLLGNLFALRSGDTRYYIVVKLDTDLGMK